MNKQAKTPADKPRSTTGSSASRSKSSRSARLVAASLAVGTLLVIGGVAWVSGVNQFAGSTKPGEAGPYSPAATPGGLGAGQPGPASPNAAANAMQDPGAPVLGGPSAAAATAPPEASPAPVDRNGKSDQELAAIAQPAAAPVELTAKKDVRGGVSAAVTDLTAVQGVATGIGEVAGPALRFKVTVVNNTAAPLSLDRALVDVSYGKDDAPAAQLSGPEPVALPASVAPGAAGDGVFIFAVPLDARDAVKIHFNLEAETPIATFAGSAPAGSAP